MAMVEVDEDELRFVHSVLLTTTTNIDIDPDVIVPIMQNQRKALGLIGSYLTDPTTLPTPSPVP